MLNTIYDRSVPNIHNIYIVFDFQSVTAIVVDNNFVSIVFVFRINSVVQIKLNILCLFDLILYVP